MARKSLIERQAIALEAQQTRLGESIRRSAKVDPKKFEELLESDNFSFGRLNKNLQEAEAKLTEATSETAFGQLLRYGVQHFMFDAYKSVDDFVYTDLVSARPSSNRQEWYAPMFGVEIPRDVALGGKFEDSRVSGLDVEVVNKKVGRMFTVERELIDDDQTGQIEQRATGLGQRLRYKEEADVMGVDVFKLTTQGRGITGVAGTSYTTAIGNRPTTFAKLSQAGLEAADIALMNITDPLGNKIMVKPGVLLTAPAEKFNAAKLLNSTLQPSVPNTTTSGTGATATNFFSGGATGWSGTINPLQGLYTLKISRWMPVDGSGNGYWYLMEPKTSIVWQDRDPLELLQEARNAGASFEKDEYRYRVRRRYATAVIEYRYLYAGNGI
jgi:phage major head subunit gpT-like protein